MKIKVNDNFLEVSPETTLFEMRKQVKPSADVLVFNGAILCEDRRLSEGDEIILIRRGEKPSSGELESLMMARHTPGVHARVKCSTVGIAGLGGLGSSVAISLARLGVEKLILADFDIVEPSNLNRQQYFIDQIGMPKTEAMLENLKKINPYVEYITHTVKLGPANIPDIFRNADVLVEAFDRADQKAMLLQSFGSAFPGKPIVAASGLAGYGSSQTMGVSKIGSNIYVIGDLESAAKPGQGLMSPRVGIAAHMQANTVLRILMGENIL